MIAVVVPCYRETAQVLDVIGAIGPEVAHIIVIDDACPDATGDLVERECGDARVTVVRHDRNRGVGAATMTGYRTALADGADVVVKIDGDGQMDPAMIPIIAAPVLDGSADYAKGNRFRKLDHLGGMPMVRVLGNLALSVASKFSSGYWNVFDPTNGFTAIHAKAAARLPFDSLSPGFFFESDMLHRLYLMGAVVADVPMQARYGRETSSLSVRRVIGEFAWKHARNTFRRVAVTYFLREFNIASLALVAGSLFLSFGLLFGGWQWRESIVSGVPATAGTVVLAALPVLLGVQMLITFLQHDSRNAPTLPLQSGP